MKDDWERIDDILTKDGIERLHAGQVLMFQFEGSPIHLKIMRKAHNGKVWVKRTHLYTEEEMRREVKIEDTKTGEVNDSIRTKED